MQSESSKESVLFLGIGRDQLVGKGEQRWTVLTRTREEHPSVWKINGGKLERDETVEAAARRETFQEVGLLISEIHHSETIEKPSYNPAFRVHLQHVMGGFYASRDGFTPIAQDGERTLINEIVDINLLWEALQSRRPILGHWVFYPHATIMRKFFKGYFNK